MSTNMSTKTAMYDNVVIHKYLNGFQIIASFIDSDRIFIYRGMIMDKDRCNADEIFDHIKSKLKEINIKPMISFEMRTLDGKKLFIWLVRDINRLIKFDGLTAYDYQNVKYKGIIKYVPAKYTEFSEEFLSKLVEQKATKCHYIAADETKLKYEGVIDGIIVEYLHESSANINLKFYASGMVINRYVLNEYIHESHTSTDYASWVAERNCSEKLYMDLCVRIARMFGYVDNIEVAKYDLRKILSSWQ